MVDETDTFYTARDTFALSQSVESLSLQNTQKDGKVKDRTAESENIYLNVPNNTPTSSVKEKQVSFQDAKPSQSGGEFNYYDTPRNLRVTPYPPRRQQLERLTGNLKGFNTGENITPILPAKRTPHYENVYDRYTMRDSPYLHTSRLTPKTSHVSNSDQPTHSTPNITGSSNQDTPLMAQSLAAERMNLNPSILKNQFDQLKPIKNRPEVPPKPNPGSSKSFLGERGGSSDPSRVHMLNLTKTRDGSKVRPPFDNYDTQDHDTETELDDDDFTQNEHNFSVPSQETRQLKIEMIKDTYNKTSLELTNLNRELRVINEMRADRSDKESIERKIYDTKKSAKSLMSDMGKLYQKALYINIASHDQDLFQSIRKLNRGVESSYSMASDIEDVVRNDVKNNVIESSISCDKDDIKSLTLPHFDAEDTIAKNNVYQFLEVVEDTFQQRRTKYNFKGPLVKKVLVNKARLTINTLSDKDQNCYDKIVSVLILHHGNYEVLMQNNVNFHSEIGKVPNLRFASSGFKEIETCVKKHCEVIRKSEAIVKHAEKNEKFVSTQIGRAHV